MKKECCLVVVRSKCKLEYYDEIPFLTTNRVKTIDEAIASRIHHALQYHALDQSARKSVWKNLLERTSTTEGSAQCGPKELAILKRADLNGREVRSPHAVCG